MLKNLLELQEKFIFISPRKKPNHKKKLKTLTNIQPPAISEAGQNECEQYQPAYGLIFLYSRQM